MEQAVLNYQNKAVIEENQEKIIVKKSKYIPQLDGLRAIAILLVLCFHAGIPHFKLGWTGVWLFFTLSGFLITGILIDNVSDLHYFKNFYSRRILRIFPVYYLCFAFALLYGIFSHHIIKDAGYYFLYAQNMLLGYTNFHPKFPGSLNHTWSLAVEEQFYLVWPFLISLLKDKRKILHASIILFAISIVTKIILLLLYKNSTIAWITMPSNIDAFAIGAFLATITRMEINQKKIEKIFITWLFISTIFYVCVIKLMHYDFFWNNVLKISSPQGLLFLFLLVAFCGLLCCLALDNDFWLSKILSLPILVYVGKISYGLYLYHFIVFTLLPFKGLSRWLAIPIEISLTFIIAVLSWHFFESKFLDLKKHFEYKEKVLA